MRCNSNSNQYFNKNASHSKLDLCDPLLNIDVKSLSTVPHVSPPAFVTSLKIKNSYMHNIEGGFAFACLHLFFFFS